jgi:hypothetical protein
MRARLVMGGCRLAVGVLASAALVGCGPVSETPGTGSTSGSSGGQDPCAVAGEPANVCCANNVERPMRCRDGVFSCDDGFLSVARGECGKSACPPVTCEIACSYGFASGPDGCLVCSCLPDPRGCGSLDRAACGNNPLCVVVDFGDPNGAASWSCCDRDADGSVRCGAPPPPRSCMSDAECQYGQVCNTWDYCDAPVECASSGTRGEPTTCVAVCQGRCVAGGGGGCVGDYDCGPFERCAYTDTALPCAGDEYSGQCAERYAGTCEPVVCPAVEPVCPDGSPPVDVVVPPHGCPVAICGGPCERLDPVSCEARRDCQAFYGGGDCACSCERGGECPPCDCGPAAFQCLPRANCFSDADCAPQDYCDFTYDDCPGCGRPALGVCVGRGNLCQGMDEYLCLSTRGCVPIYGDACPACPVDSAGNRGECPPCLPGFLGCAPIPVEFCSRDLDCGPGSRCNLCPPDPSCPSCDVCGPPTCEPALPERCMTDADCGPGRACRIEACSESFPPSCVGVCDVASVPCDGLDLRGCQATPSCQPVFQRSTCTDGCHDQEGRRTSCGPCLPVACPPTPFVACEPAPFQVCCSDGECAPGSTCLFREDRTAGQCAADPWTCGGGQYGACPGGSACEVIACDRACGLTDSGGSSTGSGSSEPGSGGSEPAPCCPLFACVPVSGCQEDADCGPGMSCNTCPSVCEPGAEACITVCGPPRCESAPPGTCRVEDDCPQGCRCEGPMPPEGQPFSGTCISPTGQVCEGRPFRICQTDAECLPDEYCQRCPPGAACFVADHCAPRERPPRDCRADADCLPDEHCGCPPGTTCDVATCLPGSPTLRVCASDLECRPDEYCLRCPPGAMCQLPDHCVPRPFRTCATDAQCLPDEFCALCPPNASCLVADHCQPLPFTRCATRAECPDGLVCGTCPPGATCLTANHCVRP